MYRQIMAALAALLVFSGTALAQDIAVKRTDVSDWPTVRIIVETPGRDGVASDYRLAFDASEESVPASSVVPLLDEPRPANIVIAVDTSRSLSPQHLAAAREALVRYVDELDRDEQVALLAFNDTVQLATGFTSDRAALKADIETLRLDGRNTELYRGMLYGIEILKNLPGHSTLLVITDGKDEGSVVTREDVLQAATDSGVRIAAIGLPTLPRSETASYQPGLEDFARGTGGLYRMASSAEELGSATYELLVDQRGLATRLYELTFMIPRELRGQPATEQDVFLVRGEGVSSMTTGLSLVVPPMGFVAVNGSREEAAARRESLAEGDRVLSVMEKGVEDEALSGRSIGALAGSGDTGVRGRAPGMAQTPSGTIVPTAQGEAQGEARSDTSGDGGTGPGLSGMTPSTVTAATSPATPREERTFLEKYWPWLLLLLLALLGLFCYSRWRGQCAARGGSCAPLDPLSGAPAKSRGLSGTVGGTKLQAPAVPMNQSDLENGIYVLEFPELGLRFPLKPGTMILGPKDSDIPLEGLNLEDVHAEFCVNGECRIRNLHSSAGIQLNGNYVEDPTVLHPGDELFFGTTKAVVRFEPKPGK